MLECKKCGFSNQDESRFCSSCGNRIDGKTNVKKRSLELTSAILSFIIATASIFAEVSEIIVVSSNSSGRTGIPAGAGLIKFIAIVLILISVAMIAVGAVLCSRNPNRNVRNNKSFVIALIVFASILASYFLSVLVTPPFFSTVAFLMLIVCVSVIVTAGISLGIKKNVQILRINNSLTVRYWF